MKARIAYISLALLVIIGISIVCTPIVDPYDDTSNTAIALIEPQTPDSGYVVGDKITIGASLQLGYFVDSIRIETGIAWDSSFVVTTTKDRDTLWISVPMVTAGTITLKVIAYVEDKSLREDHASIVVRSKAISFTVNLPGITGGKVGDACTLSVTADGTAPFSYKWYKNNTLLPSVTGSVIIFSQLQPGDSGTYYCVVSDNFGRTTNSRQATVSVKPLDAPNAPTGLLVSSEQGNFITLVWDSVPGATGYNVYMDTIAGTSVTRTAQVTQATTPVAHQSKSWYIWVTAVKGTSESMPSTAIRWSPDITKLYPPVRFEAVRKEASCVILRWSKVDSASYYIIRRNNNRNTAGYLQIARPTDTTYTDSTVNNYYYYILSANPKDTSASTDTISVIDSTSPIVYPPTVTDCQVIQPGASINAKIEEVCKSSLHKGTICPVAGLYENGTIEILGTKVEIWIR